MVRLRAFGTTAGQLPRIANSLAVMAFEDVAETKARSHVTRAKSGAEERTRTSMGLPPLAPEASASANSATSASVTRAGTSKYSIRPVRASAVIRSRRGIMKRRVIQVAVVLVIALLGPAEYVADRICSWAM